MAQITQNKKAFHDYSILEKMEAGIVLFGHEVKAVKGGQINLKGSYISIDKNNEAWIIGCHISPYRHASQSLSGYDPLRPRKLLLNKYQVDYLSEKLHERGLTILPLSVYTKGSLIKIEIGVARGKKKHDKRESIKKRTIEREIGRRLKS